MVNRAFVPGELMTDRFDRAYTLNFAPVARVRGVLSSADLEAGLRALEARHPLLRARIDRSGAHVAFAEGGRAIPLIEKDGDEAAVDAGLAQLIDHRLWDDEGPRAVLTRYRHGDDRSTLVLCFHHVVGDGSSGILAMRDLLAFLASPPKGPVEPVASPGQEAFFPESFPELRTRVLAQLEASRGAGQLPALRLSSPSPVPLDGRRPRVVRIRLSDSQSAALVRRARHDGATVHGILCAALSLAVADEMGADGLQRLSHAVDLRRYLRDAFPETRPIGDAVGYYVSGFTTDHQVQRGMDLASLAREVSEAIQNHKRAHEPLAGAPIRGPLLVDRTRQLDLDAFRNLAEQKFFLNTSAISNLGVLERLGVTERVGALVVEDFFFAAMPSVMGQLFSTAVSFGSKLCLCFTGIDPIVPAAVLDSVIQRTLALLAGHAGDA